MSEEISQMLYLCHKDIRYNSNEHYNERNFINISKLQQSVL